MQLIATNNTDALEVPDEAVQHSKLLLNCRAQGISTVRVEFRYSVLEAWLEPYTLGGLSLTELLDVVKVAIRSAFYRCCQLAPCDG